MGKNADKYAQELPRLSGVRYNAFFHVKILNLLINLFTILVLTFHGLLFP